MTQKFFWQRLSVAVIAVLSTALIQSNIWAQPAILWEAYNDYRPSDLTHPNATGFDLRVLDDGGTLRNFETGDELDVNVFVVSDSAPDDFGANSPVNDGSPAGELFNGIVDVGNAGLPGLRNSNEVSLVISFEGLDPNKRYRFRGTASRGGGYEDRWAVYSLFGADAYVAAHVDGSDNLNIITAETFPASELDENQVALNSGDNKVGSLVGWDNIEPGPDGLIEIEARQYVGEAPFGTPSAGPYGYGFTAIYVAELEATGELRITENPRDLLVPAGTTATLSVGATSPNAITYQWQRSEAGSTEFADIAGATSANYTTPSLTEADAGAQFRAVISSDGATTTSNIATLSVDGGIPGVSSAIGSANFNAVHVTFDEPMKLDQLATPANYSLSGGLTVESAVAQSTTAARIITSKQSEGTTYTLTLNNIEDLAGNPVASNTTARFSAFSVQPGTVGLEIWNNTAAGNTNPDDLQTDPRYPDSPDEEFLTTTFDSLEAFPNGPRNTYGGRFRAWLTPTESGRYEFFLQSDGGSEFHIGKDDDFAPLEDLERLPDAAAPGGSVFQEPGDDDSVSFPIDLEAGTRYAVMVLWKESNGPDYLQLAWRNLTDTTTFAEDLTPIPSEFLSFYGPSPIADVTPEIVGITRQGSNVVVEFTGGGLQRSTDLSNWSSIDGASSPYTAAPDGDATFFRATN